MENRQNEDKPVDFIKEKDIFGFDKDKMKQNPMTRSNEQSQDIDGVVDEIIYPGLVDRFKALVVDTFVILGFILLSGMIFSFFQNAPTMVRALFFIFIFALYEPILVSFGGTIGHRIVGITVKSNGNTNQNIFILSSFLRTFMKWVFGWISFITLFTDKKKRALHDMISGSVILYVQPRND